MKIMLKRGIAVLAAATAATVMSASISSAAIVGVSNNTSSLGAQAEILDPSTTPFSVLNGTVENRGQQGFDEQQNVFLTSALDVDGGSIAAGTSVASHMIFFNQNSQSTALNTHTNVIWTFSHKILGVMSDRNGVLEGKSTGILGHDDVTYPSVTPGDPIFSARGMEGDDTYQIIDPYTLSVSMYLTQPGDWIRVVTAVPLPAALPLYGAGMALLGFIGWRRKQKAAAA
ncbi:hypothetical protein GUA87_06000 [Sneathiella sp. P13V-1]|uniref:VPLPA-CTERM sorting domain-containing protein n=1 Tax=Sneathiella sp. P13V-1 TaxID=2697366 RepID=UPI00187B7D7B|nr:VPLPA-CTERM sorting domain-containing protein [Sneathiella sp. P13V-1]MBE7636390.1 hypothetical protein [Sneathiella sp. P13V-1]